MCSRRPQCMLLRVVLTATSRANACSGQDFFRGLAEYRQPNIDGYDLHFYNWNVDNDADTPTRFDEDGWNAVIEDASNLKIFCVISGV